ncbi:MAG: hypothetical protein C4K58_04380 [Flavobacteriaceae bacterium]|nr:MAG: hypothetical protein C4K58_04380 [Flavobacteriaceae bacterium]
MLRLHVRDGKFAWYLFIATGMPIITALMSLSLIYKAHYWVLAHYADQLLLLSIVIVVFLLYKLGLYFYLKKDIKEYPPFTKEETNKYNSYYFVILGFFMVLSFILVEKIPYVDPKDGKYYQEWLQNTQGGRDAQEQRARDFEERFGK